MFAITGHKGFKVTFANGTTVSVQWGPSNYCNPTHEDGRGAPHDAPENSDCWGATTAEVAAWNKDGAWHNFGGDEVKGWMSPDEVLKFLTFAATSELDTSSPWASHDEDDDSDDPYNWGKALV